MLVDTEDLTGLARIRNAALAAFAEQGVAATTIRDIAKRAGVSPGMVQHHFTSKDNLKRAVDEYVTRVGEAAISGGARDGQVGDGEVVQSIGDSLTRWMSEHQTSLRYVIRSAAEGDESAMRIIDSFVRVGDEHLADLDDAGLLRPDLDRRWAVLHVVILNLATAMLEPAINRHLDAPLRDPRQLERWNHATTALFRSGIFAAPATPDNPRTA